MPRLCQEIVIIFEENSLNERVTYPMLNFLDILIGSGKYNSLIIYLNFTFTLHSTFFLKGTINSILMDNRSQFPDDIFRLVNIEIKGHKKLYKLVSSINVFCHLIQVPSLCKRILSKMAIFLGLTHVHIRKTTARKLYEALALHGDSCDVPEENLEEILTILSETDWGMPLLNIRPVRNELCNLMCIKPPVSGSTSVASFRTVE